MSEPLSSILTWLRSLTTIKKVVLPERDPPIALWLGWPLWYFQMWNTQKHNLCLWVSAFALKPFILIRVVFLAALGRCLSFKVEFLTLGNQTTLAKVKHIFYYKNVVQGRQKRTICFLLLTVGKLLMRNWAIGVNLDSINLYLPRWHYYTKSKPCLWLTVTDYQRAQTDCHRSWDLISLFPNFQILSYPPFEGVFRFGRWF